MLCFAEQSFRAKTYSQQTNYALLIGKKIVKSNYLVNISVEVQKYKLQKKGWGTRESDFGIWKRNSSP